MSKDEIIRTGNDDVDLAFRIYDLATGDDDARLCRDIPEEQCREQPRSFLYQALAQALSKTGDAPVYLIGFLVPVRESLALIPQILVGSVIRRYPIRKGFCSVGSLVEGICVVLMGIIAAVGLCGAAAGWAIIGLLVVFSLARGVASVAAKDTLGKTVSKGRRGRLSGYAATVSGLIALAFGIYLAFSPEYARPDWLLYAIIMAAGLSWFLAAATFSRINEHPGATEGGLDIRELLSNQFLLLVNDRELRKFLIARTLMISTARAGPVNVGLAQHKTGQALNGPGWLVIASGLAGAVNSSIWGMLSEKSSRLTMTLAAAIAGVFGLGVLMVLCIAPGLADSIVFYAAVLFILGIAHAGVRIGRKTHVVDLACRDQQAEYVALSNTIIRLLLLAAGALISALLGFGFEVGIAVLSIMALFGSVTTLALTHEQS